MATKYLRTTHCHTLVFLSLTFAIVSAEGTAPSESPDGMVYNRELCYQKVVRLLNESVIALNDTIFFRSDNGFVHSSPERPIITLEGCYEMCGRKAGWYTDIGPRLSTWLIPVFLLLSNMEVSPLDKRRYLGILHLVGDPIDSLLSMLIKIEAWSRCHHLATELYDFTDAAMIRNVATVLGGFEELVGFSESPAEVYDNVKKIARLHPTSFNRLVSRTAQRLADSRTDERIRTIFAAILYVYQLIAAFVTTVGGGNTTLPGGRIGLTMYMTWVVPSVLLSNAIGAFTSRRVCYSILEDFVKEATCREDGWQVMQAVAPTLQHHISVDNYMENLSWSGAIYSYRPKKTLPFAAKRHGRSLILLSMLATLPIITSTIIGSVIIWNTPPIGINCRNIVVFVISAVAFLSAAITHITSYFLRGAVHWYVVLAKDVCVAVPSIILIFLACVGRFNSCWCWSGVFSLGDKARVILNASPDFLKYNKTTYPALVAACLVLQSLAFAGMMWVGWRGWNVLRWSERQKALGWRTSRVPQFEEPERRLEIKKDCVCVESVELYRLSSQVSRNTDSERVPKGKLS